LGYITELRLTAFFTVFIVMGLWELFFPKRQLKSSKKKRWFVNLSIIATDNLFIYIIKPAAAVTLAFAAQKAGWGILNRYYFGSVPNILLGMLSLDLVIYLQHLMFHAIPLLWRLHMVHHADLDIDVTTGLRFHPLEILISIGVKLGAVAAVGPPPEAVLAFEVLLNATSMFNHGNVGIPAAIDRILRLFVVTPDMHRVHHSVTIRETNSNFGFNFPWWDRIFGTYRPQPALGHKDMVIGLAQFRDEASLGLLSAICMPFKADPGYYAINKSGMEPKKNSLRK